MDRNSEGFHVKKWLTLLLVIAISAFSCGKTINGGNCLSCIPAIPKGFKHPAWSPDGTKIALDVTQTESPELYVMDYHGTNLRRLSASGSDPIWSPDGALIAYNSLGDITIIDAEGKNNPITVGAGGVPSWSPDGSRLVYSVQEGPHHALFIVNKDGSHKRRIMDGDYNAWEPNWSPVEDKIAFINYENGPGQVFTVNVDGTNLQKILDSEESYSALSWSPDGLKVACIAVSPGNQIVIVNSDGSNLKIIPHEFFGFANLQWSPASDQIAIYNYGVFLLDINTEDIRLLASGKLRDRSNARSFSWSPDGNKIVFERQELDIVNIYVVDVDGSNLTQLTDF